MRQLNYRLTEQKNEIENDKQQHQCVCIGLAAEARTFLIPLAFFRSDVSAQCGLSFTHFPSICDADFANTMFNLYVCTVYSPM